MLQILKPRCGANNLGTGMWYLNPRSMLMLHWTKLLDGGIQNGTDPKLG